MEFTGKAFGVSLVRLCACASSTHYLLAVFVLFCVVSWESSAMCLRPQGALQRFEVYIDVGCQLSLVHAGTFVPAQAFVAIV